MSVERIHTRSFVTGSHAYGTPDSLSDVDLVILVTEDDLKILKEQSDDKHVWDTDYQHRAPQAACLRFGKLNVIACTTEEAFMVWRKGTKKLKADAPVLRSVACGLFGELRARELEGDTPKEARERGERIRKELAKDDRIPKPKEEKPDWDEIFNGDDVFTERRDNKRRDEDIPF